MSDTRFTRQSRLLTGKDFQQVFDHVQVKVPDRSILILARCNQLNYPRIGFIISKKNIRQAVKRNHVRRIIRESFRLNQYNIPPLDIIIMARKGLGETRNEDLHSMINRCWNQLKKRSQKITD